MTYHPKCMFILEEFYTVYPPSELAEARQAAKNGWNVLIEYVDEHSKNIVLDEIQTFERKKNEHNN